MFKKTLASIVTMAMVMSFAACGDTSPASTSKSASVDSASTSAVSTEAPAEEATPEPTEEPTAEPAADDGIISMETDDFSVAYSRHEVGTDYEGKPCLYYYYTFTNKASDNQMAGIVTSIKAFQNGVECSTGISMEGKPEIENYMKEIQSGGSLEVCQVYELADTSDVTMEAKELISFDDAKDTQIIALQ